MSHDCLDEVIWNGRLPNDQYLAREDVLDLLKPLFRLHEDFIHGRLSEHRLSENLCCIVSDIERFLTE